MIIFCIVTMSYAQQHEFGELTVLEREFDLMIKILLHMPFTFTKEGRIILR